jgi:hypothetical protein
MMCTNFVFENATSQAGGRKWQRVRELECVPDAIDKMTSVLR